MRVPFLTRAGSDGGHYPRRSGACQREVGPPAFRPPALPGNAATRKAPSTHAGAEYKGSSRTRPGPLKGFPGSPEVPPEGRPMTEEPTTRPSLLVRIQDAGDDEAWGQFVEIYAPLI